MLTLNVFLSPSDLQRLIDYLAASSDPNIVNNLAMQGQQDSDSDPRGHVCG